MPLLLDDADVRAVLTMDSCLKALESAYKQEGLGRASNRTKSTMYIGSRPGWTAQYISFEGALRDPPVFALVVRSHVQEPGAPPGGRVLMLFSGETGELLALFRAEQIQTYRVGGSAGLAAREMARRDARVVGILGSGGTARAHALAYAAVRQVERFKVYSPNPEHRTAFAEWITRMTEVPAQALDDAEAVVRGSDIVASCTASRGPVVKPEWLDQPGLHMTCVRLMFPGELEPEGFKRFDRLVTYFPGESTRHPTGPERPSRVMGTGDDFLAQFNVIPRRHTLSDLLLGKAPGRESGEERNYFFSEGTGVQFAAVCALVYEQAREQGVGQEMPAEWARWFRLGGDAS